MRTNLKNEECICIAGNIRKFPESVKTNEPSLIHLKYLKCGVECFTKNVIKTHFVNMVFLDITWKKINKPFWLNYVSRTENK